MKLSVPTHAITHAIEDVIFTLYFFFAIFMPDIMPISTRILLLMAQFLLILWAVVSTKRFRISKRILKILIAFAPFLIYFAYAQCLRVFFDKAQASIYLSASIETVKPLVYIFIQTFATIALCKKFRVDLHRCIRLMIYAAVLQLLCVLLSLAVPSVRETFLNLTIRYSKSDRMMMVTQKAMNTDKRGYGFANNLFDSLGYIISMLITLTFLEGFASGKKRFILLSVVMLIIPAVNTRTGLILSFLGFFVVFCFYFDFRRIGSYLLGAAGVALLCLCAYSFLIPKTTQEFIEGGISDTTELIQNQNSSGVYQQILQADIVFPSNMLLGSGASPENLEHYRGIDSGYIQFLWRFGIIGSLLLLGGEFFLFCVAWRCTKSRQAKCILVAFSAIILMYLFKLYSWTNTGAAFILFTLPVVIILDGKKSRYAGDISLSGGRNE